MPIQPTSGLLDKYPEWADNYIKEKNFQIKTKPDYLKDLETIPDMTIKNAKQLHKYILEERDFWGIYQNHIVNNYHQSLNAADSQLRDALNNTNSSLISNVVGILQGCQISSKTRLAKDFFVKFKEEPEHFFKGFMFAIQNSIYNNNYSINSDCQKPFWHKGMHYGFEYMNTRKELLNSIGNLKEEFQETAKDAIGELNIFTADLTSTKNKLNDELSSLQNAHINKLEEMKNESDAFIKTEKETFEKLEKNYKEKIAFEEPAKDWGLMSVKYGVSGRNWLILSSIISVIIIALMSYLVMNLEEITDKTSLFNIVRQALILTVITSVGIYILRITIKLALSNFHLSKDATERERLTRFYISMKNSNLIQDSERPLIITSLFSRSDTGLLKEGSTPEMPNAGSMVDLIKESK
ncbi:MAG: DUF6161 domain-containing protein [Fibromonadales bacterium]|nr:DUF6161 domain-containing protein [Fibromonadales bacterium]